jgi:uncharacterized membrane protein
MHGRREEAFWSTLWGLVAVGAVAYPIAILWGVFAVCLWLFFTLVIGFSVLTDFMPTGPNPFRGRVRQRVRRDGS